MRRDRARVPGAGGGATRPRDRARPGAPPVRVARRDRGAAWVPILAAAAAALAYLPSLLNGFARDDHDLIPALVRPGTSLWRLLWVDFWAPTGAGSGLWRPLVTLSLWIDAHLGNGAPLPFHLENVAAHAAASALVGVLLVQAGCAALPAGVAALGFALLPAHAEAVAWVVGRTDVLCGLFALAALALDRRARAAGRRGPGAAALAAFACALLAKESAAALVLVVAAAEWVRPDPPAPARLWRWVAPYLAVVTLWLVAHQAIVRPGGLPIYVDPSAPERWPLAAWRLLPHFFATLWPWFPHGPESTVGLPTSGADPALLAGAAATVAAFAAIAWLAIRRAPALVPATLFVAPLLPVLGTAVARVALPSGERLVYLSSAGAAWLVALGLGRAQRAGAAGAAAGWVTVAILIAAGTLRLMDVERDWHDDAALFGAMTRNQPHDPVGWIGLADALAQQGDRAGAERLLARAQPLGPRLPALHLVRAALHYRVGEWPQVVAHADSALALAPGLSDARELRATALLRLRRLEEAGAETARLMRERPDDPAVLAIEGQRRLVAGDPAGAVDPLARAVRGAPDDVAAWYALGVASGLSRDQAGARAAFERTVALDPRYYDGWLGLARACAALGDREGAGAALERAGALPESRDGRAAALRRALGAP